MILRAACLLLCAVPAIAQPATRSAPPWSLALNFDAPADATEFVAATTGEADKRKSPPHLMDGRLYLLQSWWKSSASVAFAAPARPAVRVVEASWDLILNTGTDGAGFAWLPIARFGPNGPAPDVAAWEAPSLPGTFGVGFDASNPPNRDPFRGSGNAYDRPQHEVSLHWNDMEIVKRTTPVDFRDEKPHAVQLRIEFVPGGAEITLTLDVQPVYERYFIPAMVAYAGRAAFGARNGDTAGDVWLDTLRITGSEPIPTPPPPVTVVALDHQLNDVQRPRNEATVTFPDDTDSFARIICTLRLDQPETRFDPWDRTARVYAYADDGTPIELLRYITPYHRGHEWQVDVTDFRPLLRGPRRIAQVCHTQGEGWVVTVTFDFYPGPVDRLAYRVIPLWSGAPEIGNPDAPVENFYVPRILPVDEHAAFAKVYTVVTGHGMHPNTNNAAEFMPLGRTLTVNGESYRNVLWKADNYLNPCRPQGGTWKYDRAGWAPGDVVRPWSIDVSHLLDDQRQLRIEYKLDEYVNEARGQTWGPTHETEAYLILYRKPG